MIMFDVLQMLLFNTYVYSHSTTAFRKTTFSYGIYKKSWYEKVIDFL